MMTTLTRAALLRRVAVCLATASLLSLAGPGRPAGAEPSLAAAKLPEITGWKLSSDVRVFGPGNLYEQIDGASELYLSYGFKSLVVGDYAAAGRATITAEIYRHASANDAFGIYSQERPAQGNYRKIGAEGYLEPPILNFVSGDAYVKLSADGLDPAGALQEVAAAVASELGGAAALPSALASFPEDGQVAHSERFAGRDFLGYEFLRSAFTADYKVGEARFQLFVLQSAAPSDSAEMLRRYLQAAGQAAEGVPEKAYLVRDPYNGEVALFWKGSAICGVLRLQDAALRDRYLEAMRQSLERGL